MITTTNRHNTWYLLNSDAFNYK